jgi:cell fate regulator YaaT (PSP1 superfamily)
MSITQGRRRQAGNDRSRVDIFELAKDLSKFAAVTIIYETAPVQSDFRELEADVR